MSVQSTVGTPLAPAFEAALAARPDEIREGRVTIGGRSVALRVAGADLFASLVRTLASAPAAEGPADLRMDLWDSAATGVFVPDGPQLYGERQGSAGGMLVRSPDRRWLAHHHADLELCVDLAQGRLVGGLVTRRASLGWHPARPLQHILIPWLAAIGLAVVHAAMVVRDGTGALIAGPTGHGKSTSAAAALTAGFGVIGDDTVAVEAAGDGFVGHCIHATVKTRSSGSRLDPGLAAAAVPLEGAWEGESVLYLGEARPEAVVASAPLAAILLPRLSDRRASTVEPMKPGAALSVLTGEALSLEPGQIATGFERVVALVGAVPAFRLHVGRNAATIPIAISDLLERLRGA